MPANRSRTHEWRRCLQQIAQRNGAIEIAIARHYGRGEEHTDLMWRVRLLHVGESEIIVEQPASMGHNIEIRQGIALIAIMAIGQNRWMFQTTNLGSVEHRLNQRTTAAAIRLLIPKSVERCQRREYYRFDTAALNLPQVEIWPLLDPASVVLAERANEVGINLESGQEACKAIDPPSGASSPPLDLMPHVGPSFTGTLMNIGGGGVGLRIEPRDAPSLGRCSVFWLRLSLPESDVPICASGKLVHSHMESTQATYAGLAFDFSFNPAHQRFVVDQICRYIAQQQRMQLHPQSDRELRQSA